MRSTTQNVLCVLATCAVFACGGEGGSGSRQDLYVMTSGGGRIEATPQGYPVSGTATFDCGPVCRAAFGNQEAVTLTAVADADQTFLGWGGACSGSAPECVVVMGEQHRTDVYVSFGPPAASWAATIMNHGFGNAAAVRGTAGFLMGGVTDPNQSPGLQTHMYIAAVTPSGTEEWRLRADEGGVVNHLASTSDGRAFATGSFGGSLQVDGFNVVAENPESASFVLDVDPTGSATGLESFGGMRNEASLVVAASDGAVLVGGTFEQQIEVGADQLTAAGGKDIYLARRASTIWTSISLGSTGDDLPLAMAEDNAGRIWLVVALGGSVVVGTESVGPGLALLVLDDLVPVWTASIGGDQFSDYTTQPPLPEGQPLIRPGGSIVPLPNGDMLLATTFSGAVTLDDRAFTSSGPSDWLIARLRSDGSEVWANSHGGEGVDELHGLALLGDHVVAGGAFVGPAMLGGSSPVHSHHSGTPGVPAEDGFLAAYDVTDGGHLWARRFGGFGSDALLDLTSSPDGVFAVGTVQAGPVAVGTTPTATGEGSSALGILIQE